MKHRLALILSAAALGLAVLGATPVGNAAHGFLFPAHSVGTRELKDDAVVGTKVKDHSLLAQDFKQGQLPAGPQGPQGKQGPAGPVDTSRLLGRDLPHGSTPSSRHRPSLASHLWSASPSEAVRG